MGLPESFFIPEGAAFLSTELTRGPWSKEHQHGGPPSALMARAAERFDEGREQFFVARLLVDYLKPIPIAPLSVTVEPLKLGRAAQRLLVRLSCGGEELARAQALRVRRASGAAVSSRAAPLPGPDGLLPWPFNFFPWDVGYHRAVEVRFLHGRLGDNVVTAWGRQTVPLVNGEQPSGLQRVVVLADAESGMCNPLDPKRYTFVNPDLLVMLDREPLGEWVGLDCVSSASPLGIGIAQAALHDVYGPVGRSAQTLVVEAR